MLEKNLNSFTKKFKITIIIIYLIGLFLFYFLLGFLTDNASFVKEIYSWNNSYSIEMFNFIPFKNIIYYISNPGRNGGIEYLLTNVIFYVVIWIPMGYFLENSRFKLNFKKKLLLIFLIITIVSLLRLIFLIGFFDIDKIILSCLGFCLGFYIKHKFVVHKAV